MGFRRQCANLKRRRISVWRRPAKTSEKIGWGLEIVFDGEISGDDVLDYPVPHNNYTNLGTQRTGNAIGLDALWFPAGDSAWRPYAGLGLYYDKRAEIAQSNVTGWYYKRKEKSALNIGGELGLRYPRVGRDALGYRLPHDTRWILELGMVKP